MRWFAKFISLVTCVSLLWSLVTPVTTYAIDTAPDNNQPILSLYRAQLTIDSRYALDRLAKADISVLTSTANTATVLADLAQLSWLSATGYRPAKLVSVEHIDGVTTPKSAPTSPTLRAAILYAPTHPSTLRSWGKTLPVASKQVISAASATDSDGDGISDDEEALWCTNPDDKTTVDSLGTGVDDGVIIRAAYDWMASKRERSVGYIPFAVSVLNTASCTDSDSDLIPNGAELLLGLDPSAASTDKDKYGDGYEVFGRNAVGVTMPATVKNPGRHPLVAAFPKPVITINDDSIRVDVVTTILANGNPIATTNRTYSSSRSTSVESVSTTDALWDAWLHVDTTSRARTASEGGTDTWTVYTKDTESSDGGDGEETAADWSDITDCVTAGFYEASSDCSDLFFVYPDEAEDPSDPCLFDASGCGSDTLWDTTTEETDSYTIPTDGGADDAGIGDVSTCSDGFNGDCAPEAGSTITDDVTDAGSADSDRTVETSGDTIEQPDGGSSLTVVENDPVVEAPPAVPELDTTTSTDAVADDTDQTVEVVTFEEQDVEDPGQIVTVGTYDHLTAVDSAHAADLSFSYTIANQGTDYITELKNIKFNVYLNNDEYPITTYSLGADEKFENKLPGTTATFTIPAGRKIPLTLDQLKALEVDPVCAQEVRQGTRAATPPCPGGRVRITVADMSYGVDQTFYDDAVASGVMVGIDDGNDDNQTAIEWYVIPTWGLAVQDTIADVVQRYFPMTRDANGVLTGVKTPEFGTTTPPTGCTGSSVVGSGVNAILWCPFELSRTQWMEVLTSGVTVSQDIATAAANPGAKVILRLERDRDSDGYSDDTEREYGTNPIDAGQRPLPILTAAVSATAYDGVTHGTLMLANSGDFAATGIKATMFSPNRDNTIRNNQVGGSGELEPAAELVVGSSSALDTDASNWTGAAQLQIDGYYTGSTARTYTLTATCSDTCEIGSGDTALAWSSDDGTNGSLAYGAGYASPTQLALGSDGITLGMLTGTVVDGETLVVSAQPPDDTFQWSNSDAGVTAPIVVVEYGDAAGAHRFAMPQTAYRTSVADPLNPLYGTMMRAPTVDIVSSNYTPDVGGDIRLLLTNPLTMTLQATNVLLRITDADGTVMLARTQALDDVASGPYTTAALDWSTAEFTVPYDPSAVYALTAAWGDHQGNIIDTQVRLLSDLQNDRAPELNLAIEGTTRTTLSRGTAAYTIDFGTTPIQQGMPMKKLFSLTNVGDIPLRGSASALENAQTSFDGGFIIPAGMTLPYMFSYDTGQLPVGNVTRTLTIRTSDPDWPTLTITIKAKIAATPAGATLSYVIDPYRPLTTGLYVQGPQSRRTVINYNELPFWGVAKVNPLVLRDDLSDQVLGLGRKVASNPAAYGFDPALVGLSGRAAALDVGGDVTSSETTTPSQTLTPTEKMTPSQTSAPTASEITSSATMVRTGTPNPGLTQITQIAVGNHVSYLVQADGTLVTWGSSKSIVPSGLSNINKIAINQVQPNHDDFAVAVTNDGRLLSWGNVPTVIPTNLTGVVDVAAGLNVAYAVFADGSVRSWAQGGSSSSMDNLGSVKQLCAGAGFTLVLRTNGSLVGLGAPERYGPVSTYSNVKQVSCMFDGWVGIRESGELIGHCGGLCAPIPTGLTDIKNVSSGAYYSLAQRNDDSVIGWGGIHADGAQIPASLGAVSAVQAGFHNSSVAIKSDGSLAIWGLDSSGMFDLPSENYELVPRVAPVSPANTTTPTITTTPPPAPSITPLRTVTRSLTPTPGVATTPDINNGCYWRENNGTSHRYEIKPATYSLRSGNWSYAKASSERLIWSSSGFGDSPVNGYLATVNTSEEHNCLYTLARNSLETGSAHFWLGASDASNEGTWLWVTGPERNQSVDSRYWVSNEPNNDVGNSDGEENCAAMIVDYQQTNATASFNDESCSTGNYFIVEFSSDVHDVGLCNPNGCYASTVTPTLRPTQTAIPAITRSRTPSATGSATQTKTSVATDTPSHTATVGPDPQYFFNKAAIGSSFVLGLLQNGTLVTWGMNREYQTNIPPCCGTDITDIAVGANFALAVKGGNVYGWGANTYGQITIPASAKSGGIVSIGAGAAHSLAVDGSGAVIAWGSNSYGQRNVPTTLKGVTQVVGGNEHSAALTSDGKVIAWGGNSVGQLSVPANLSGVKQIAAGFDHTLAVLNDGSLRGWGGNVYGQSTIPSDAVNIKKVSAGTSTSLALRNDGSVIAWGWDNYGQVTIPDASGTYSDIAAGYYHTIVIADDGGYTVLGEPTNGIMQTRTVTKTATATRYVSPTTTPTPTRPAVAVMRSRLCSGGHIHMAAHRNDGTVIAWGRNDEGRTTVPAGLTDVKAVHCIGDNTFAIKSDGSIIAWGSGAIGAAALPANLYGVVKITGGKEDGSFATGVPAYAIALRADGTVVGWGNPTHGQLDIPVGIRDIVDIAAGTSFVLALKKDGTIIGWGNDDVNEYGGANRKNLSRLSGISGVKSIAAAHGHSMALLRDGRVLMWGNNDNGVNNVPSTLTNVKQICTGAWYSMALKENGQLIGWGINEYGQLNISAYTGITDIGCASSTLFAVDSTGIVRSRGYTGFGLSAHGESLGSSATETATRVTTPTRTLTPSKTLTRSRTVTLTPSKTPTPNDSFVVDKPDTSGERERRIIIPASFTKSARYAVDNGLLYTFTFPNQTQSASIHLPRTEYLTATLEIWPIDTFTGRLDIDIGANGSTDWSISNAAPGKYTSGNLAVPLTNYLSTQAGDSALVPIAIRSPRGGALLVTNVVGVPKGQSDLTTASVSIDGVRTSMVRGNPQLVVPRGSTNTVRAVVRNDGRASSTVSTAALAAQIPGEGLWYIDSQPIPRLATGQSTTLTFVWDTAQWPDMTSTLRVIIDPYNTMAERSESNNLRMTSFRLSGGALAATATPTATATKVKTPTRSRTSTRTSTPTITRTATRTPTRPPATPTMIAGSTLRLRYSFADDVSSTVFVDRSAANNALACAATDQTCPRIEDGQLYPDMGGALFLSRADQTVARAQLPVTFGAAFSVSAWVRIAEPGQNQVFISHGAPTTNKSFQMGVNAANQPYCTAGANTVTGSITMNGAGHMITCTFDSATATMRLYYDRDIVGSATGVFGYTSAGVNTFSVGASWLGSDAPTNGFDGWIDEITMMNSALTSRDIEWLYNQPRTGGNRLPTRTATRVK